MKLNKVGLLFLLFVFCVLSACNKVGTGTDNNKHSLSIYLVKDLSVEEAMSMNIDELPLETLPVLTDNEIEKYNWGEHTFYIKNGFNIEGKLEGKVPLNGRPFVFLIDGKRIYLGSFWNMLSSLHWSNIPTINSVWSGEFTENKYHIAKANEQQDPREDKRIFETLKSLGKLE
ncbi:hypothetical protein GM661_01050 [Iocasia frigidifontis]|uniref:Uncharacterized protein n=1 Tax=Iocasia fonsfrigidae TaxID=2682810 RepID=A0A8A7KAU8_9FIRM|nr:hypothetical protein [Iocasia fonsfrigidae]QTL96658.1 hypothetical protein GM661_01050 [Iocasia fonsfrigidae]